MEKTEAPEEIEAWSWTSVAEDRETSPKDSKETTLAVSMSEPEPMSTSEMISVQDIARLGRSEVGNRVVMGVCQLKRFRLYFVGGGGGTGGWHTSPPMGAKTVCREVRLWK